MADATTELTQPASKITAQTEQALKAFEEDLFQPKKLRFVNLDSNQKDDLTEGIIQSVYESADSSDLSNQDKKIQFLGDIFEVACHQFMTNYPESLVDEADPKPHKYVITDIKFVDEFREKLIKKDLNAQMSWDIGAPDFLVFEETTPGTFQLAAIVETKYLGAASSEDKEGTPIPEFYQAQVVNDKKVTQFGKARNFIDYLRYCEGDHSVIEELRKGVNSNLKEFTVPENVRMIYMVPQDQSIAQLTNDSYFRETHLPFLASEFSSIVAEAVGTEDYNPSTLTVNS